MYRLPKYSLLAILLLLAACTAPPTDAPVTGPPRLSAPRCEGTAPELYPLPDGGAVALWAEKNDSTLQHTVFLAQLRPGRIEWDTPMRVPFTLGTSAFPGAGPQFAATLQAWYLAWYMPAPHDSNAHAERIFWAMTRDQGRTWTAGLPINFFPDAHAADEFVVLEPLGDRAGAVWLSHVGGFSARGSVLWGAFSQADGQMGPAQRLSEMSCECCRPALTGRGDTLRAAWREIREDSLRDILVRESVDGGQTWSTGRLPLEQGWNLDGCPVAGPVFTQDAQGAHALLMYTEGAPGKGWWFTPLHSAAGAKLLTDSGSEVHAVEGGWVYWQQKNGTWMQGMPGQQAAHIPAWNGRKYVRGIRLAPEKWLWIWQEKRGDDWPGIFWELTEKPFGEV